MIVSPHEHEILAITPLMTQYFLNWRRLTESQVQKHKDKDNAAWVAVLLSQPWTRQSEEHVAEIRAGNDSPFIN